MTVELVVVLSVVVLGGVACVLILGRAMSAQTAMLSKAMHESNELAKQFALQIKPPSEQQVEMVTAGYVREKAPIVSHGVAADDQAGFETHAFD